MRVILSIEENIEIQTADEVTNDIINISNESGFKIRKKEFCNQ